jgi:hypothetical protein
MKPSKPIPLWLTIDVLIIVAGLGLIALGTVITSARIFGAPVF